MSEKDKKMFDSRRKDQHCNRSEEVIAYVYEEIAGPDRERFEKHLGSCPVCAEEVGAFSGISSAMQHWRKTEFDALETPRIEIDYNVRPETVTTVSTTGATWLSTVREYFRLSPVMMRSAAAFGILAVVAGALWFYLSAPTPDIDVVREVEEPSRTAPVESAPPENVEPNELLVEKDARPLDDETVSEQPAVKVARQTPPPVRKKTPVSAPRVKKAPVRRQSAPPAPDIAENERDRKQVPPAKNGAPVPSPENQQNLELQEVPRLTYLAQEETEEEEDLRLSDLFADVDSDE